MSEIDYEVKLRFVVIAGTVICIESNFSVSDEVNCLVINHFEVLSFIYMRCMQHN